MTALHKLWLGSLLGTTANFAVYLLLAARVLESTGSALLASLVFAAQWILPVMLVLRIEHAGRTLEPRRLMLGAALAFAALAVATAAVLPAVAPVLALCAAFGALEALVKSGRLVALKRYYEGEALQKSVSSLASAMYIGAAAGGALFALVPQEDAVAIVLGGAVAAHLVAALVLATLPSASVAPPAGAREVHSARAFATGLRVAAEDARVFEALFCLVLVCGVLQGFHNVARTALPLVHLDAGNAAVGLLQVVAGAAIIAGVVVYRVAFARNDAFVRIAGPLGYACAALLVAPALTRDVETSFVLYFAFIFAFELLFVHFQTRLVVSAQASAISLVSAFQYAVINLAMLTTAVLGGALVDATGLVASAALFAGLFCLLFLARDAIRRSVAPPRAPGPAAP